jgi:hypothetical protein
MRTLYRAKELVGPAVQLKGKRLQGFLAAGTVPTSKVKPLVEACKQHGFSILVPSGRSLSLGNSRVPRLPVRGNLRSSMPGMAMCAIRMALRC